MTGWELAHNSWELGFKRARVLATLSAAPTGSAADTPMAMLGQQLEQAVEPTRARADDSQHSSAAEDSQHKEHVKEDGAGAEAEARQAEAPDMIEVDREQEQGAANDKVHEQDDDGMDSHGEEMKDEEGADVGDHGDGDSDSDGDSGGHEDQDEEDNDAVDDDRHDDGEEEGQHEHEEELVIVDDEAEDEPTRKRMRTAQHSTSTTGGPSASWDVHSDPATDGQLRHDQVFIDTRSGSAKRASLYLVDGWDEEQDTVSARRISGDRGFARPRTRPCTQFTATVATVAQLVSSTSKLFRQLAHSDDPSVSLVSDIMDLLALMDCVERQGVRERQRVWAAEASQQLQQLEESKAEAAAEENCEAYAQLRDEIAEANAKLEDPGHQGTVSKSPTCTWAEARRLLEKERNGETAALYRESQLIPMPRRASLPRPLVVCELSSKLNLCTVFHPYGSVTRMSPKSFKLLYGQALRLSDSDLECIEPEWNRQKKFGEDTALAIAAIRKGSGGQVGCVRALFMPSLRFDQLLRAVDDTGQTIAHLAAAQGNAGAVRALITLTHGAALFAVDTQGRTLAHHVASSRQHHGQSISVLRTIHHGYAASKSNYHRTTQLIYDLFASPDECGQTMLHLAAQGGHDELIQAFVALHQNHTHSAMRDGVYHHASRSIRCHETVRPAELISLKVQTSLGMGFIFESTRLDSTIKEMQAMIGQHFNRRVVRLSISHSSFRSRIGADRIHSSAWVLTNPSQTLESAGISTETVITATVDHQLVASVKRPRDSSSTVSIRLDGSDYTFNVECTTDMTIKEVKAKIQDVEHIPISSQVIMLDGQQLLDSHCVPVTAQLHLHEKPLSDLVSWFSCDLLSARDTLGRSIAHHAVLGDQIGMLRLLSKERLPRGLLTRDCKGLAPVHHAAKLGLCRVLSELASMCSDCVKSQAHIITRVKSSDGRTCAHFAAAGGHVECLRKILEIGGKEALSTVAADGSTPAHAAAAHGHVDVLRLIYFSHSLELRVIIICSHRALSDSELSVATNDMVQVSDMTDAGWWCGVLQSSPSTQHEELDGIMSGYFPASHARLEGTDSHGLASLMQEDRKKRTPLHAAALGGHTSVLHLIHALGGSTSGTDRADQNVAHFASKMGHNKFLRCLHKLGAVSLLWAEDAIGFTPADLAVASNHLNVAHTLQSSVRRSTEVDIKMKRAWLSFHLRQVFDQDTVAALEVDRENVIEGLFGFLQINPDTGKDAGGLVPRGISVRFAGEPSYGDGLRRDWFGQVFAELLDPAVGLFLSKDGGRTVQPNPYSRIAAGPNHLGYFMVLGRLTGLALYHREPLNAPFSTAFLAAVFGFQIKLQDLESVDPELWEKRVLYLRNGTYSSRDGMELEDLFLSFQDDSNQEEYIDGASAQVDLKEGGSSIAVDEDNKAEYLQAFVEHRLVGAIRSQIDAFREGLSGYIGEALQKRVQQSCSVADIQLLVCGTPVIDTADWKASTEYTGGYTADSQVVRWFWAFVESLDPATKGALLCFVTGCARVPAAGFSMLMGYNGHVRSFQIEKVYGAEEGMLPSASTCFNLLRLPEYASAAQLRERCMLAVRCGGDFFDEEAIE